MIGVDPRLPMPDTPPVTSRFSPPKLGVSGRDGALVILRPCACGCGEEVVRPALYRPGHDSKHRDRLVDLLVGRGSTAERARRIQSLIDGLEAR